MLSTQNWRVQHRNGKAESPECARCNKDYEETSSHKHCGCPVLSTTLDLRGLAAKQCYERISGNLAESTFLATDGRSGGRPSLTKPWEMNGNIAQRD